MTPPRILLSPPCVGSQERQQLLHAFDSNWIAPLGPEVDAFEAEVAATVGVHHAAALSSGTAALHLALVLLGVGPDDDVLVPTFTFAASANPVRYCGANPVFIDSTFDTWSMDPALVQAELADAAHRGKRPKAVIAVDVYGQCADWDALREVCAAYGVPLVEDAAAALGSTYRGRNAGSFGHLAALSFNGNKIITTSGGGMLLGNDASLLARARNLAAQARDPAPHYEHSQLGFNYRMSNLLAGVGRAQLQQLPTFVARRQAIHAHYRSALQGIAGLRWIPVPLDGTWNSWLSCCLVDAARFGADRDTLLQAFAAANIEVRPLWKPLHQQPLYASSRRRNGHVAAALFDAGLCLPSGVDLSPDDLQRVCDVFLHSRRSPW